MRIKIIGENDCARATRQLLRQAGFAVTEFLPAEVVTHAPHAGYVITIELAPASTPDQPGSPLRPTPAPQPGTTLPPREDSAETAVRASAEAGSPPPPQTGFGGQARLLDRQGAAGSCSPAASVATGFSLWSGPAGKQVRAAFAAGQASDSPCNAEPARAGLDTGSRSGYVREERRADARPDRLKSVATHAPAILIDSVDSPLEAAVLRHITQLSAAPVVLDRPGGVVHSERELRIVVPLANVGGDEAESRADEAAAVAVEFGVLRGLLDLTSPPASGSGAPAPAPAGKKWWQLLAILLSALLTFAARPHVPAAARLSRGERSRTIRGGDFVLAPPIPWPGFHTGKDSEGNFSAVSYDSMAALARGNFVAVRAAPDRVFRVHLGECGRTAFFGVVVLDVGGPAVRGAHGAGCAALSGGAASRARAPSSAAVTRVALVRRHRLNPASPAARPVLLAAQGQFGTSQINLALVGGNATASGGTNGSLGVGGVAADGSATAGNPVLVAGKGSGNARVPIVCDNWTPINVSNTTATKLVNKAANKNIYICSINVVVAAASNVALIAGTQTTNQCDTSAAGLSGGATAATGWNLAANGGLAYGSGIGAIAATSTAGLDVCIVQSASTQLSGAISWTQF